MTKAPSPTTDATMEEKLSTLLNDKRVLRQQRDTFASRASADFDLENQGRFAKAATVVGATAKQPEYGAPNWANDPTGAEPPLGFDINETPIVGQPWEVEASLERTAQEASLSLDAMPVRGAGAAPSDIRASSAPANPTISKRKPQT